jgi:hypothetical protein
MFQNNRTEGLRSDPEAFPSYRSLPSLGIGIVQLYSDTRVARRAPLKISLSKTV